jgi:hypothetical protein
MRLVTVGIGVVSLGAVAAAWLQDPDPVTADQAIGIAERAFDAAGLPDATVDDAPIAGVYTSAERGRRIEVWRTTAEIDGGDVELWLARADGEAVFLDDRTADGAAQLLTDEQFEALADHDDDPNLGAHLWRNVAITAAAVLFLALGVRLERARSTEGATPTRDGGRLRAAFRARRRAATPDPAPPPADRPRRERPLRADPHPEEDPR